MLGYIIYGDGPKRPELGERQLPGGAFVTLRMGQQAHPLGPLALRRAELQRRLSEIIQELRYLNVSDEEILSLLKEGEHNA